MLTLTRKLGEEVRIGDEIVVVIKEIHRNHIRVGILAPKETKVYRGEVYDQIVNSRDDSENWKKHTT